MRTLREELALFNHPYVWAPRTTERRPAERGKTAAGYVRFLSVLSLEVRDLQTAWRASVESANTPTTVAPVSTAKAMFAAVAILPRVNADSAWARYATKNRADSVAPRCVTGAAALISDNPDSKSRL